MNLNLSNCRGGEIDDYSGMKIMKACSEYASNIRLLNVKGNKLGRKSVEILTSGLSNLQELNICRNRIESSALYFIGNELKQLRILNVSFNKIGNEGIAYLMNGNLNQLEELICMYAKINDEGTNCFPTSTCEKLQQFNLCGNNISTMEGFRNIAQLSTLTSLDLSHTKITIEGVDEICRGKLEKLRILKMEGVKLDDSMIERLCCTTQQQSNSNNSNFKLSTLLLPRNAITDEGARIISKHMKPHLKTVNLFKNLIDSSGIIDLLSMGTLESLTIHGNETSSSSSTSNDSSNTDKTQLGTNENNTDNQLIEFVGGGFDCNNVLPLILNEKLHKLVVPRSKLSLQSIDSISSWHQIKNLDLGANMLGDAAVEIIAKNLTNLVELDLSQNNLTDSSMKFFCDEFFPKLSKLHLDNNFIGEKGAKLLFTGNIKLTLLYLSSNPIGEGILHLNNCSSFGNCLRVLGMRSTQIGKFISRTSFNHLANLKILEVSSNGIGDEGFDHLCLQQFHNLTSLALDSNSITKVSSLMENYIVNFPKLKTVFISNNRLTKKAKQDALKLSGKLSLLVQ